MRLIAAATIAAALIAATVITAGTARAETPQAPRAAAAHKKSPTGAFLLSFGGTFVAGIGVPAALLLGRDPAWEIGGLGVALIAPSAGTLYAGDPLTPGLALRGVGVAVVAAVIQTNDLCAPNQHDGCSGPSDRELYLLEAAAAAIVVGGLWDSIRAVRGVNERNARLDLTLTPLVTPTSSGLALTGRF